VGIVLDQIPETGAQQTAIIAQPAPVFDTPAATNPILRIFPSFVDFAFLAPLAFLIARPTGFQSLLGDGDTGWHIRTGDWMLQNGRIPAADFFSFSKPGGEWFAWEWLWDAAFSWLQKTGGMAAVLLVSSIVICLASVLVYAITRSKSGNSLVSLLISLVAMCAASFHWLARPHLFTFLFVAIFLHLLDKGTVKSRRMLAVLPVLMVLWTNLHGGFVAGLLIAGAYAGGETLRFLCSSGQERRAAGGHAILYAKVFAACLAATFVNPYFYQLHVHVFGYLTDGYQMKHIGEFQSISFHHPLASFFEAFIVLGLATAFWNLYRRNFTAVLLLLGWMHLSLVSGRNISIFVIVASPFIAEAVVNWISDLKGFDVKWIRESANKFLQFCARVDVMDRVPRLHLVCGGAVLVAGSMLFAGVSSPRFQAGYDPKSFPVQAVDELQKLNLTSRVFSTDDWSGYVIYRLYPNVRVFLDGRSDYYGPELGEEFSGMMSAKAGWEDRLKKYKVETILVPKDSILSIAMKGSSQWRCIYKDDVAAIYRPSASEQQVSASLSRSRESSL
jgi:hypothetical protein